MPLLFTKETEGRINAVYTGRFAFVRGLSSTEADLFIAEKIASTEKKDRLLEELEHSRVYIKCSSGLIISAIRWFVRIFWLVSKNEKFVYRYYKLRAIFFVNMYSLHEDIVEFNRKSNDDSKFSEMATRDLKLSDQKVMSAWKKELGYTYLAIQIFYPVLYLMGYITTKNFTIVSSNGDVDELVDHNSSVGGLLNDIGTKERGFFDPLLKYLIVENWSNMTYSDGLSWVKEKFRSERDSWRYVETALNKNKKYQSLYPSFHEYCHKISDFVLSWSSCKDINSREALVYFLKYPDDKDAYNYLLKTQDVFLKKAIDYFYYHGN
ncbi:hypothetical protein [Pseudoalteromonas xiamenensis]|uniref:Uncharacterized protein n=1 Tax=Pseudoalteromonas xiamenensis TaxID=882626 RepID=A0A975HL17_9GAMM|nr:hypothetical protein [Pseudoalteromonas xiamenensis]QTH71618.1 hypothetical protein J5O05_01175 [Pseudoalteromonas xiamenensis]